MKKFILLFSFLLLSLLGFSQTSWYWADYDGNHSYNDANNWDDGLGGTGLPATGDDIVFDPAFTTNNCNIDVSTSNLLRFFSSAGYTGTITVSNNVTVTFSSTFSITAGVFKGGNTSSALHVGGNFKMTAGTFTKPPGVMSIGGTLTISGGTYNENTSFTSVTGSCTISGTGAYIPVGGIFAVSSATICSGSSTVLSGTSATSYVWAPNSGLSATTGVAVTASPVTATNYTVVATYSSKCTNTAKPVVSVNSVPTISVSSNSTICNGASASLSASGGSTYSWAPSTSLSATTGSSVTASPIVTISYTVTGAGTNGCTATAAATVTVISCSTGSGSYKNNGLMLNLFLPFKITRDEEEIREYNF